MRKRILYNPTSSNYFGYSKFALCTCAVVHCDANMHLIMEYNEECNDTRSHMILGNVWLRISLYAYRCPLSKLSVSCPSIVRPCIPN